MLILADLHLGKSTHFRKHGIPVHSDVLKKDILCIINLLKSFEVTTLLVLGDLFHSSINAEWEVFKKFIKDCSVRTILIKGNHDKLPDKIYEDAGIILHDEILILAPFIFSHHPILEPSSNYYRICGHIHPAYSIRGSAKQSISLRN